MKISPLKKNANELRTSEDQYHKMVEEVEDYAILMLDASGHIVNWNKGAEKIKGYSEREIVGRHFSVFYTEDDQTGRLPDRLIKQAREEGKAVHEGWRVRKDGTTFWGSTVITSLHGDNNEVVGFSKVTRDLTERKVWEDKLKQYTRQLEAQNRELQQFAYIAAHDMKEPLRKVQYYHSLLLDGSMSAEKQKNYLQRSAEAAGRMQGLIDDLLAFTRIAEPVESFEQVDMNALIAEVWQFYQTTDRIQAELATDVLPPIRGIAFQIRQLIVNLLGNSIKYRSPDRPLQIRMTGGITGKFYRLSITDNGIGFEKEQAERIFEIFQRLHRRDQYPGTGIGLAICRKVMENHKGHIEARGVPGQGATFECYFLI